MFKTAYNVKNHVTGEDYSKTVSQCQPEQVLPLKRILDGIKNGTIVMDGHPQQFDIAEHRIDVAAGTTPTQTNANIDAATTADLAKLADQFGEDITARPNFTLEDAQDTTDAVEAALFNVEVDGEQAAAPQSQAADKPKTEALDNIAAENR